MQIGVLGMLEATPRSNVCTYVSTTKVRRLIQAQYVTESEEFWLAPRFRKERYKKTARGTPDGLPTGNMELKNYR